MKMKEKETVGLTVGKPTCFAQTFFKSLGLHDPDKG